MSERRIRPLRPDDRPMGTYVLGSAERSWPKAPEAVVDAIAAEQEAASSPTEKGEA